MVVFGYAVGYMVPETGTGCLGFDALPANGAVGVMIGAEMPETTDMTQVSLSSLSRTGNMIRTSAETEESFDHHHGIMDQCLDGE